MPAVVYNQHKRGAALGVFSCVQRALRLFRCNGCFRQGVSKVVRRFDGAVDLDLATLRWQE